MSAFKGSELARKRSAVATAHRQGDPDRIADTRREYAEARIEAFVTKVLDAAPPLTDEQRCRLAELLAPVRRKAGQK